MRFISPTNWPWLFMLGVPILLYLFRRRPRTVRVSTLAFFKLLARAHQESPWLRRLKFLLSLLLCLLMIGLPAAALLRPVVDSARDGRQLRTLIVVLDRSASMAAVDEKGRSRLDDGLARVRQRLGAVGDGTAVCLVVYDRRPEVLLPASHDRRQLERALAGIRVRPMEGDSVAALKLAGRLAELEPAPGAAAIWHVTDEAPPANVGPTSTPDGVSRLPVEPGVGPPPVEWINVALADPQNVGITAFQIRRLPMQPGQLEAFVQLHSTAAKGSRPVEVELEARLDNEVISVRKLAVGPDAPEALLIPLRAARPDAPSRLWLKLKTDKDCLAVDNQAFAVVPPARPLRVLWISPAADPYTHLAMGALMVGSDMKVLCGKPGDWPTTEKVDVVMFDGCVPKDWPPDVPVILLNPPNSVGPVQLARLAKGLPVEHLRLPQPDHALLLGVASERVCVQQTAVLQAGDGVEPLWVGPAGAVLLAGQYRDQRVVAMAFDVSKSERLAFMASYQLLIGNAVYWTTEAVLAGEGFTGNNHRAGELVALSGAQGQPGQPDRLTWRRPDLDGEQAAREQTVRLLSKGVGQGGSGGMGGSGSQVEMDRIGFWEASNGAVGSASLLSARETMLPSAERTSDAGAKAGPARWTLVPPDLLYLLLWLVLAVLVVESWLYHRHSVY